MRTGLTSSEMNDAGFRQSGQLLQFWFDLDGHQTSDGASAATTDCDDFAGRDVSQISTEMGAEVTYVDDSVLFHVVTLGCS